MKRMGFYTGKIYDDSVNPADIKECCQYINYKEPILDDEELIIRKRKLLHERCIECNSCEESKKGE
ncbi:hypothetical protein [Konateibacter massiliensis]|uniref:hypothetical protein n=1 Tax=Konateibacter massiliensis TaxID=2002841 RepID=UPI000C160765|nr:hypothetical protein [Konateibacter massiliensis]